MEKLKKPVWTTVQRPRAVLRANAWARTGAFRSKLFGAGLTRAPFVRVTARCSKPSTWPRVARGATATKGPGGGSLPRWRNSQ